MNSENSQTSDPYRLLINLSDKIILKRSDKYVLLSNPSIYYKQKNIKNFYKNNKFKTSALTWNEKFERNIFCIRYSRLFQVYHQKHEVVTDESPI